MRILAVGFAFLACLCLDAQDEAVYPVKITHCIEDDPKIQTAVRVDMATNPYYLRGDFDNDGVPDYALAVKGVKSLRNGVLICLGNGAKVILGADSPKNPPFSDMPGDNFVAPHWEVATRTEILEERKTNPRAPVPRGESILMIWEDGFHYIYWDGSRFRWSLLIQ